MADRQLRLLTRYNAWANERLFEALAKLPVAELTVTRSKGPGSILKTLNHAQVVDRIWQANLEGRPHGFTSRNTEVLPAFEALREAQRDTDAWYVAFADRLEALARDEVVRFTFVGGGEGAMTRGDMLLHVVNHKTYHRGYVAEMLYEGNLKPPTMDLPVYIRDAAPAL